MKSLKNKLVVQDRKDVKVFEVDGVPEMPSLAKKFGEDEIINPKEQDTIKAIDELTIHLVSPGGRIVIGGLTGVDVSFPVQLLTKKDIEQYGTRQSVGKFPEVI